MEEFGSTERDEILPAGTRLGKYEIVRRIGAGGMGAVYEAIHVDIGKRVAVKTLSSHVADAPNARQRFLREAQLTSRLRHPHVVDLTDMGAEGQVAYLVMELLTGEDLAQRLERTGPFAPRELVDIMLPVCSALVAAHEAGIIHRDLKPRNIFLATGPSGVHPKVLDFGISKSVGGDAVSPLTNSGVIIGTPHYLAPEQTKSARLATPASDQYALGVILYKCLTGRNPFDGAGLWDVLKAIAEEVPVPLRTLRPDLPAGLDRVVERAMKRVGWDRFPSVSDFGRALVPFASERARLTWQDAFGPPAPDDHPKLPQTRDTHTLRNPIDVQPVRRPQVVTIPSGREESATLPPAVSDASLTERPRSRSLTMTGLLGAVLALGAIGYLLATRATSPPVANTPPTGPAKAAAGAPAQPAAAAPPAAPPPPAPVAAPAAPPTAPVAPVAAPPPAPTPAVAEPPVAPPTKPGASPARRSRPTPPGARRALPAPPAEGEAPPQPRSLNPNKAPVID